MAQQFDLNWGVLTTNQTASQTLLRGGLYVDRTGVFGSNLIAVTGGGPDQGGEVWSVSSAAQAVRLANITNDDSPHLEGVVTLSGQPTPWGPLENRIVTGAESKIPPLLHTVHTNGTVADFDLGIAPEDFDIIEPNYNLYCLDQGNSPKWFLRSSLGHYLPYFWDLKNPNALQT